MAGVNSMLDQVVAGLHFGIGDIIVVRTRELVSPISTGGGHPPLWGADSFRRKRRACHLGRVNYTDLGTRTRRPGPGGPTRSGTGCPPTLPHRVRRYHHIGQSWIPPLPWAWTRGCSSLGSSMVEVHATDLRYMKSPRPFRAGAQPE